MYIYNYKRIWVIKTPQLKEEKVNGLCIKYATRKVSQNICDKLFFSSQNITISDWLYSVTFFGKTNVNFMMNVFHI